MNLRFSESGKKGRLFGLHGVRDSRQRSDEKVDSVIPDNWQRKLLVRHVEGKGNCLFATERIAVGEVVGYFEGPEILSPTVHSVHLEGKIIDGGGILKNLAHSCEPNAYFKGKEKLLYCRKTIEAGDEVTIDYLHTEPVIAYPFVCRCGSSNCRGPIGYPKVRFRDAR